MAFSTKIDGITSDSQDLVDMYLETNKKSARTIITALRRLIEDTKKCDIRELNHNDYTIHIKPFVNESTPAKLKQAFIKYLYAYEFIKDKSGFDSEYWNPKEIIEGFEKEKKKHEKTIYKPALSFVQIEKIQQFLFHVSEDDFDYIKLDLAFYMCFYTDIDNVHDLREADSNNYKNGIWTINNKDFDIPERYKMYLLYLQGLQYSKFSRIHSYIEQLGEQVGIKGLYPKEVIKARQQMLMPCFECGEKYLIFKKYWASINGKIMCNFCAEEILNITDVKKKYITDELQCYEIDILTLQEKINTEIATNSFETLRQEIPKKFDFSHLHEFLSYIGKLGEKYVYEYEKSYLKDTKYYDMVDITPSLNHENGYDIFSFERNGTPVMIEVKSTTGTIEDSFSVTNRELETAKKSWSEGKKYKFYRVSNILAKDRNEISLKVYERLSEGNFEITGVVYKVKEKSDL